MTGSATSRGHGAVAESGGTIFLHAGTTIQRGWRVQRHRLGASGAGSQVILDALVPVTMQGRGAMGVYLHDGGQVTLLPGSTLQMNGTRQRRHRGRQHDRAPGRIGSGLVINFDGVHAAGDAGSTGLVAFNNSTVTIDTLTVQGADAANGIWARPGGSVTLTGQSVININAVQNPTFYTLQTATLVTPNGPVGSISASPAGRRSAACSRARAPSPASTRS